jgi:hypothetical protein
MRSVVAMELFAGCQTKWQECELASFLKTFAKAGRTPTSGGEDREQPA